MKLSREIQRIHDGLVFQEAQLPPPDNHAAELMARADRTGAIRYCKEMYNECLRHGKVARAEQFLAFVDQIQFEPQSDDPGIEI